MTFFKVLNILFYSFSLMYFIYLLLYHFDALTIVLSRLLLKRNLPTAYLHGAGSTRPVRKI